MKSGKKIGVMISLMLLVGVLSASLVMAEVISFITPLENVDGVTSGWSTNDAMVDIGSNWDLLSGNAEVHGFANSHEVLTHRGTRGLGVKGAENDEVDSNERPERIEIWFDNPYYINYLEIRSLFVEGDDIPEEGDIEFLLSGSVVDTDHMVATQSSGNGVWSKSYTSPELVDKIILEYK